MFVVIFAAGVFVKVAMTSTDALTGTAYSDGFNACAEALSADDTHAYVLPREDEDIRKWGGIADEELAKMDAAIAKAAT